MDLSKDDAEFIKFRDLRNEVLEKPDLVQILTISIAFWFVIGGISFFLMRFISETFRGYKTIDKKWLFVTYFTAIIHAIMSTYLSYYTVYYTCEGWEKGDTPLNTMDCLLYPRRVHYYIIANSIGYLIYDFIIYKFIV